MFCCPQRPLVFSRGLCSVTGTRDSRGHLVRGETKFRRKSTLRAPKEDGPVFEPGVGRWQWRDGMCLVPGSLGVSERRGLGFFSSKRRWGHYSKIVLLSVLCSGMPCDVNYWLSFAVSPVLDGFISTPISVSSTAAQRRLSCRRDGIPMKHSCASQLD